MKLVLVHDWLTGMRGGEKCLEAICRRFPDAELFTLLHVPGTTSGTIEQRSIHTSFLQRVPGAARHYRYLLPWMPRAIESLEVPADADLVLSFSHAVAKSIRVPVGVPHVCYCFSPMRYAWQLRDEYFSRQQDASTGDGMIAGPVRGAMHFARHRVLDAIQVWDRATSTRVTHFVACSQTIAERIRDCYDRDSTVIHPPVDTDFYSPSDMPREDFYLCVSALAPYKRIELAIRACQSAGRRLIVIGQGPEFERLRRLAGPETQLLGWQSNETIRDQLRRCRALLFPGCEDFGIVPVEAQACGAPVIAYGRGGATETVWEGTESVPGTGRFFPEQSVESLTSCILQFEAQPERCSPTAARMNALRFHTANYERSLLDYLEAVRRDRQSPILTNP